MVTGKVHITGKAVCWWLAFFRSTLLINAFFGITLGCQIRNEEHSFPNPPFQHLTPITMVSCKPSQIYVLLSHPLQGGRSCRIGRRSVVSTLLHSGFGSCSSSITRRRRGACKKSWAGDTGEDPPMLKSAGGVM